MLLGQHAPHRGQHRAQAAHRDAHLVHALGHEFERGRLVAQQHGDEAPARLLQRRVEHHLAVERQSVRVHHRRPRAAHQPIAALPFAARLDAARHDLEQAERHVPQHDGLAALQFELDLVDGLAGAVERANLAAIDRDLDLGPLARAEHEGLALDHGGEERAQRFGRDQVAHLAAALRRVEIGCRALDRVLPLAARQHILAGEVVRLDGLDELPALLAHPQHHLALPQRVVVRVVIDGREGRARRPRPSGHGEKRRPRLRQIVGGDREFEFELRHAPRA